MVEHQLVENYNHNYGLLRTYMLQYVMIKLPIIYVHLYVIAEDFQKGGSDCCNRRSNKWGLQPPDANESSICHYL